MSEAINKMNDKPWKCGICGTAFKTIKERMSCETACIKKMEEEAKKAAEIKKKQEQAARKFEVDKAFDHAMKLRAAYLKDYDTYTYVAKGSDISNDIANWINHTSLWDSIF